MDLGIPRSSWERERTVAGNNGDDDGPIANGERPTCTPHVRGAVSSVFFYHRAACFFSRKLRKYNTCPTACVCMCVIRNDNKTRRLRGERPKRYRQPRSATKNNQNGKAYQQTHHGPFQDCPKHNVSKRLFRHVTVFDFPYFHVIVMVLQVAQLLLHDGGL